MPDASVDSIVTDPPYELRFMNADWDRSGIANNAEMWSECLRVLKPGGHLLAFSSTRTSHRMVSAIEDAGFEIRDSLMWIYGSGFPKNHDISKAIDKAAGVKGKKIGEKRFGKTSTGQGSGWNPNAQAAKGKQDVHAPATEDAKCWEGWGTALKPAHEPICLARKPLSEKTIADNVIKHGTGGLNIDGCRVGDEVRFNAPAGNSLNMSAVGMPEDAEGRTAEGRWPANIIHDGLDEPWAKYFYCTKASKRDRNEGCEEMEEKQYSHDGRNVVTDTAHQRNSSKAGNHHPTVKPTALMRHLIKLVTPPNGVVLDPFMGSGSTGKAAALDGFSFIGIDLDPEYVAIAKARIDFALDQVAKETGELW